VRPLAEHYENPLQLSWGVREPHTIARDMLVLRLLLPTLATVVLSSCRAAEPGAGVYYRTGALSTAQADSLEQVFAEAPFQVQRVAAKRYGTGVTWGEIQLVRGADSAAELARLATWLRRQPGVAAVGSDSAALAP